MTTTRSYNAVQSTTPVATTIYPADPADFIYVGTGENKFKAGTHALYVINAGDPDLPAEARISIYSDKTPSGRSQLTIEFKTYVQEVDDSDGTVLKQGPAVFRLTSEVPGVNPIFDKDGYLAAVQNVISLLWQTLDGGVPEQDVVSILEHNGPKIL